MTHLYVKKIRGPRVRLRTGDPSPISINKRYRFHLCTRIKDEKAEKAEKAGPDTQRH